MNEKLEIAAGQQRNLTMWGLNASKPLQRRLKALSTGGLNY